jgi:branched-chain amino acid transport system permease protein
VKILLGGQTVIDNSLILGALLIIVVLGIPRGVVPAVIALWNARSRLGRRRKSGESGMRRRLGAPAEERA